MNCIHHGGSALKKGWMLSATKDDYSFDFQSQPSFEGESLQGGTLFPSKCNFNLLCYYLKGTFNIKSASISFATSRNGLEESIIIPVELRYRELTGLELIQGLVAPIDSFSGNLIANMYITLDNAGIVFYHRGAYFDFINLNFGGIGMEGLFFCCINGNFVRPIIVFATGTCILVKCNRLTE